MKLKTKLDCQKRAYLKVSFDHKLSVIDEINNGRISINHASKVYGFSRRTIAYWRDKLSSFEQNIKAVSKNEEIKKLKERIEDLEFIKDFQQDLIVEYEIETGDLKSKKYLPEQLAKEIEQKRKKAQ